MACAAWADEGLRTPASHATGGSTVVLGLNRETAMKRILVIGAGKSATVLIQYLLEQAASSDWHVRVADLASTGCGRGRRSAAAAPYF